jgi:hypothetical protein
MKIACCGNSLLCSVYFALIFVILLYSTLVAIAYVLSLTEAVACIRLLPHAFFPIQEKFVFLHYSTNLSLRLVWVCRLLSSPSTLPECIRKIFLHLEDAGRGRLLTD